MPAAGDRRRLSAATGGLGSLVQHGCADSIGGHVILSDGGNRELVCGAFRGGFSID